MRPFFALKNTYFCENLSNCYDIEQKTWLFNPMADWCRRFDRIESFVYGRFHLLGPKYTEAISYNLREVILLLNFCYFFSLYFIPIQLHQAVVFIDKIVQRAFGLVTVLIFLFATCLIFLNVGDVLATFLLVYYGVSIILFRFGGFGAPIFKVVQAKRL